MKNRKQEKKVTTLLKNTCIFYPSGFRELLRVSLPPSASNFSSSTNLASDNELLMTILGLQSSDRFRAERRFNAPMAGRLDLMRVVPTLMRTSGISRGHILCLAIAQGAFAALTLEDYCGKVLQIDRRMIWRRVHQITR